MKGFTIKYSSYIQELIHDGFYFSLKKRFVVHPAVIQRFLRKNRANTLILYIIMHVIL